MQTLILPGIDPAHSCWIGGGWWAECLYDLLLGHELAITVRCAQVPYIKETCVLSYTETGMKRKREEKKRTSAGKHHG